MVALSTLPDAALSLHNIGFSPGIPYLVCEGWCVFQGLSQRGFGGFYDVLVHARTVHRGPADLRKCRVHFRRNAAIQSALLQGECDVRLSVLTKSTALYCDKCRHRFQAVTERTGLCTTSSLGRTPIKYLVELLREESSERHSLKFVPQLVDSQTVRKRAVNQQSVSGELHRRVTANKHILNRHQHNSPLTILQVPRPFNGNHYCAPLSLL